MSQNPKFFFQPSKLLILSLKMPWNEGYLHQSPYSNRTTENESVLYSTHIPTQV
ncbi:hypothetical protein GBAR_LOCUS9440 [Geodia barretti]|uniref:Uncharacterized protein n=1 Tax=Geodia barretti TaxID=519541 RepID=A0AA35RRB4_GEOBA|nr:hypothetical protein GBAR_LOCUS9440 [Geodia barretti]